MPERTPFFKGFHRCLFGRPRRSAQQTMVDQLQAMRRATLCQLCVLFAPLINPKLLRPPENGDNSRQRGYSLLVTFWAFLSQVITPNCACREIVRKVQGWCAARRIPLPSGNTSAYCQARKRLPLSTLHELHQHTAFELERRVSSQQLWLGRRVKVVDGTGVSMPDTVENQKEFPQPGNQKKGCGFPVATLVGCFSLATGALLDWVEGNLKNNEQSLCRKLFHLFEKGDVLLADRGFCSYALIATMINKMVDCVIRLTSVRNTDWRCGKRLSKNERLVIWEKPVQRPKAWSKREWNALPDVITLRLLKIPVEMIPGFRTKTLILVTTFTDPIEISAEDLAILYLRRWRIELYFRDIKITLDMDVLRCKTPEMVRKEIAMHVISYNFIRALMQRAVHEYEIDLERLSFKGTVDLIRQWIEPLNEARGKPRIQAQMIAEMVDIIANDRVPYRPNREEPRARKRRPKAYPLLTKPRHEMVVLSHENRSKCSVQ